jgi:ectoine hydroxylase-related dioxygenase (phytanoyl-CoA dioxygenase family)
MALLPPDLIQRFDEEGFVLTPNLLTSDELETYGASVDRAVARRTKEDTRSVAEKSTYEQSFVQCMRLWETDQDVRPLTFHAGLAQAAAELLGVGSVRLWQDQALYKEPGGRITDPHQDATFWPIGDAPLVSAWIPLDGSTRDNGATAYVPGSHRAGRLKVVNIMHTTEPYDILGDPALQGAEPVVVEAPAGSVVWHHGLTVHQALPNETDLTRRVFTVVYIAASGRRVDGWDCFPLDRDGVGVGETIEGPGMPVVWPVPNELPRAPAKRGRATGPQMATDR